MKYIQKALALTILLLNFTNCAFKEPTTHINGDFLTGFETGIFLRKSVEQVNEYGCPKAQIKVEDFRKVKDMLPAVSQMVKIMNKDD